MKSQKQAIAIGLSEAGASDRVSPKQNRHNLAHTKKNEAKGDTGQQAREGKGSIAKPR